MQRRWRRTGARLRQPSERKVTVGGWDRSAGIPLNLGHGNLTEGLGDGGRFGSISYRSCCNPVGARIIMRLEASRLTRWLRLCAVATGAPGVTRVGRSEFPGHTSCNGCSGLPALRS
jgi:hypothetical protein